jgi:hypothetical protein
MLKQSAVGTITLALMIDPSSAASIGGLGLETCSTWIVDHQSYPPIRAWADDQWMIGYLSGAGKWGAADLDPLNGMDARAIYAWVSNYCEVNPSVLIQDAGNAFIHVHPH